MGGAAVPPGTEDADLGSAKRRDPAGGASPPGTIGVDDAVPQDARSKVNPPPATVAGTSTVNGTEVTVLDDARQSTGSGADTSFEIEAGEIPRYGFDKHNKITDLDGTAPTPKVAIQTLYSPGSRSTDISGYGRGTTDDDKKAGNVTVGFHESCHRADYFQFVKDNALPVFVGKIGMTVAQYKAAASAYLDALKAYRNKVKKYTQDRTDEVGSPPQSRYRP
jgi:hypothetical protein